VETLFRSKRDAWLGVVIWVPAILLFVVSSAEALSGRWVSAGALAAGAAAMLWVFYGTCYSVNDTHLRIRCGMFRWRIERESITSVLPSNDETASPATSLDRLEVRYAQGQKRVLVSPEDKAAFCAALNTTCQDLRGRIV
jgi:hypothetical protein